MFEVPTTKIFSIATSFDKVIDVFIKCGVLPNFDGKITATHCFVKLNGDVLLNPTQVFRWQIQDIMAQRPDVFVKYPHANFYELLALALQNKLIEFYIRNWHEMFLLLPQAIKDFIQSKDVQEEKRYEKLNIKIKNWPEYTTAGIEIIK